MTTRATSTTEAPIYYAITGCGWGSGDTPEQALETYYRTQARGFPHLSRDQLDEDFWGFVWKTPPGTTGFSHEGKLWWYQGDDPSVEAEDSQRVADIGQVPERWALGVTL